MYSIFPPRRYHYYMFGFSAYSMSKCSRFFRVKYKLTFLKCLLSSQASTRMSRISENETASGSHLLPKRVYSVTVSLMNTEK